MCGVKVKSCAVMGYISPSLSLSLPAALPLPKTSYRPQGLKELCKLSFLTGHWRMPTIHILVHYVLKIHN